MMVTAAAAVIGSTNSANAADVLTGDTRLACEAILCLSSGTRPGECAASLSRYFSIHKREFSDTLKARFNFLKLCPVSIQTLEMRALVTAIKDGAGRCDAEYLNRTQTKEVQRLVCPKGNAYWPIDEDCYLETITVIENTKPAYCAAYENHDYTYKIGVTYAGDPMEGGHWKDVR